MKIELHPNNALTCFHCKNKFTNGYQLEFRDSWFRGDDEYELVCKECQQKEFPTGKGISIVKTYKTQSN